MYVTRMYSCGVLVTILQSLLATETEISSGPMSHLTRTRPYQQNKLHLNKNMLELKTEDNLTLRLRDQRTQQAESSICKRASCKSLQTALNATFQ